MNEIIETIIEENENDVSIFTKNDDQYQIAPADCFLGGEGMDGYICDALGNVVYSSMKSVLLALEKFVKSNDDEIVDYEYV